jgi:hypothetical protein
LLPTQLGSVAAALQPDGKVAVTFRGIDFVSIVIRRYDSEGALDATFVDSGAVRTGLGFGVHPGRLRRCDTADGKIVVAGTDD